MLASKPSITNTGFSGHVTLLLTTAHRSRSASSMALTLWPWLTPHRLYLRRMRRLRPSVSLQLASPLQRPRHPRQLALPCLASLRRQPLRPHRPLGVRLPRHRRLRGCPPPTPSSPRRRRRPRRLRLLGLTAPTWSAAVSSCPPRCGTASTAAVSMVGAGGKLPCCGSPAPRLSFVSSTPSLATVGRMRTLACPARPCNRYDSGPSL